jgi:hypothetical protein
MWWDWDGCGLMAWWYGVWICMMDVENVEVEVDMEEVVVAGM